MARFIRSDIGNNGLEALDDCAPEPLVCRSVRWLPNETEQYKAIVPHLVQPDPETRIATQGRADTTIPCGAIMSIRERLATSASSSARDWRGWTQRSLSLSCCCSDHAESCSHPTQPWPMASCPSWTCSLVGV